VLVVVIVLLLFCFCYFYHLALMMKCPSSSGLGTFGPSAPFILRTHSVCQILLVTDRILFAFLVDQQLSARRLLSVA